MKNFSLKILPVVILLTALSSCVSLPSQQKMQSEVANYSLPKQNQGKDTLVYVVRPSNIGALIKFNVFVDNKEKPSEVGYTKGNEYIYFSVKPGSHTIFSKAENWAEIAIDGKPSETIFIKQNASMGFVMARNSVEKIDETEAKYHIRKAKVGLILKENLQ